MAVHTHNPTTDLGRHNQKGQVKPDYLVDALENAEKAHLGYEAMIDTDISEVELKALQNFANYCQRLARDADTRWQQEVCPHKVKRTYQRQPHYKIDGEAFGVDEKLVACIVCHREFS